jgi:molecular chaperone DnaK
MERRLMAEMPIALGIDLGTTFSVVAQVSRGGIPVTLPNAEGSPTTPSVVLFDRDQVVVGAVAREAVAADPEFVVQLAKRRMGSEWAFEYGGVAYRAEHISALIVKKLLRDAQMLAGPVDDAVVTVPAYFNDTMRAATRQAAELAGVRVLGLLSEPTAAAIAFGYDKRPEGAQGIVVDLGGGTFDVTVIDFDHDDLTVEATGGDAYLGGANFDKVLFDHFVTEFDFEHGIDVRDPDALSVEDFTQVSQDWLLRADRAKHDLSTRDRTMVQLQAAGLSMRLEVTRSAFQKLSGILLDEITEKMLEVVQTAGRKPSDLTVVLAVGGATRMPMVQERIRSIFGKSPDTSIRPDEAVALGAAVYAARLQIEDGASLVMDPEVRDYIESMTVTDVSAHSLGVSVFASAEPPGSPRTMEVLLGRNTPLPDQQSKVFYTRHAGETRIVVPILEGEGPDPEDCNRIGQVVIEGLPPDRPAFQPVSVTMAYDRDGLLEVTARDEDSQTTVSTTIERTNQIVSTSVDRAIDAVRAATVH